MVSDQRFNVGHRSLGYIGLSVLLWSPLIIAEVTFLGSNQSLTGNITISADQGRLAGANLFHDFSRFHIRTNESVTFTGPSSIANILARVSGNEPSEINGLLQSTIEDADLFLLNPNGVIFGPGSAIAVDGAFYVSTADSLHFDDGTVLMISDTGNSELSIASPQSFGFTSTPASIRFDGSNIVSMPNPDQAASSMVSLNLFGGQIEISDSRISLAGTPVQLVAITSSAAIPLWGSRLDELISDGTQFGDITVSNVSPSFNANIDTSGDGAGKISILASSLQLNRASIFSDTAGDAGGGGINIQLAASLALIGGSRITTDTTSGSGRGGAITIEAKLVTVDGVDSLIASNNNTGGGGGNITISADEVLLSNQGAVSSITRSSGAAGQILLDVNSLRLHSGAQIRGQTAASGVGANIIINATDSLSLGDPDSTLDDSSGVFVSSAAFVGMAGRSGSIVINTARLNIYSGQLQSRSLFPGSGAGGDILISATDFLLDTAAEISTNTFSAQNAGTIRITADRFIQIGTLSASTGRSGNAGSITIEANSYDLQGSIFAFTASGGDGGNVDIVVDDLTIDGGLIDVRTEGTGNAGTISIRTGNILLSNNGEINSSVFAQAAGAGGAISITASALRLESGGRLSTSTAGVGAGGTIGFDIAGLLSITGEDSAISSDTSGPGLGGTISGNASRFEITLGGGITTLATDSGFAGNINLGAVERIDIIGGKIRTDSEQSGGGNITINVIDRLYLNDAELTASARGSSIGDDGGNVTIDPVFIILNHSRIVAQAIAGDGGIIELASEIYLSDRNSLISATSELGNDGEVRISAPDSSVTGVLGVLEPAFADQAPLLDAPCAATALNERSSLVYQPEPISVTAPDDLVAGVSAECMP